MYAPNMFAIWPLESGEDRSAVLTLIKQGDILE